MNRRKKQIYMASIFTLALVIGVGYAFLTSTLNITGNTKIKENSWDVHFENFQPTTGSVTATSAGIDTNKTSVNYTVTLSKPGDFYEFTVDAVNEGTIDAMIGSLSNTGLTARQLQYMTYTVTYLDGIEIAQNQALPADSSETFKVRVEYKKDISVSDLPEDDQQITLTFSATYVQADNNAVAVNHPVCRRATTLHNDGTHTFGSLGTTGTLTPGDAFDCDVNKDKNYDASTERFYYVSPLDTDSSYAVLIYSNNTNGSEINNTTGTAYNLSPSSTDLSLNGPVNAKLQLPTTAQWKNVSLSNITRNIYDQRGTLRVSNFSYEGYAARLLTYQEAQFACGPGEGSDGGYLDTCTYLMENTKYSSNSYMFGYWLENQHVHIVSYALFVSGKDTERYINVTSTDGAWRSGVRPAIEVPLSEIQK